MVDIDLTGGTMTDDEIRAVSSNARDRIAQVKARAKKTPDSGSKPKSSPRASAANDTEIKARGTRLFERLADLRDARDDSELADALREEAEVMSQGIVNATSAIPQVRGPVMFALSLSETVLAFGRVIRILAYRWGDRRRERMEAAQAEYAT